MFMTFQKTITGIVTALVAPLILALPASANLETPPETGNIGRLTCSWHNGLEPALAGIGYSTPSFSGITGRDGSFTFREGETVAFFIGEIELGFTAARERIELYHLLSGKTVTDNIVAMANMLLFLWKMDADDNPANGIEISDRIRSHAHGHIDFYRHPDHVEQEPLYIELSAIAAGKH